MAKDKLLISLDPQIKAQLKVAAARAGTSMAQYIESMLAADPTVTGDTARIQRRLLIQYCTELMQFDFSSDMTETDVHKLAQLTEDISVLKSDKQIGDGSDWANWIRENVVNQEG